MESRRRWKPAKGEVSWVQKNVHWFKKSVVTFSSIGGETTSQSAYVSTRRLKNKLGKEPEKGDEVTADVKYRKYEGIKVKNYRILQKKSSKTDFS